MVQENKLKNKNNKKEKKEKKMKTLDHLLLII